MIDKQQRDLLAMLADEMRIRGVTVLHIENDGLKLEMHMTPSAVGDALADGSLSPELRSRLAGKTTPPKEVAEKIKDLEDEEDLAAS